MSDASEKFVVGFGLWLGELQKGIAPELLMQSGNCLNTFPLPCIPY